MRFIDSHPILSISLLHFTQCPQSYIYGCQWSWAEPSESFCMDLCALSCVWLFCDPMDCSPPGFSVTGIFQARILEWFAISYSRGSSQPRDRTWISLVSCIGRWILYHCATWETWICIWYLKLLCWGAQNIVLEEVLHCDCIQQVLSKWNFNFFCIK